MIANPIYDQTNRRLVKCETTAGSSLYDPGEFSTSTACYVWSESDSADDGYICIYEVEISRRIERLGIIYVKKSREKRWKIYFEIVSEVFLFSLIAHSETIKSRIERTSPVPQKPRKIRWRRSYPRPPPSDKIHADSIRTGSGWVSNFSLTQFAKSKEEIMQIDKAPETNPVMPNIDIFAACFPLLVVSHERFYKQLARSGDEKDDSLSENDLANAAAVYAASGNGICETTRSDGKIRFNSIWPFEGSDCRKEKHTRFGQLAVAAAMILAEMSRIIRDMGATEETVRSGVINYELLDSIEEEAFTRGFFSEQEGKTTSHEDMMIRFIEYATICQYEGYEDLIGLIEAKRDEEAMNAEQENMEGRQSEEDQGTL